MTTKDKVTQKDMESSSKPACKGNAIGTTLGSTEEHWYIETYRKRRGFSGGPVVNNLPAIQETQKMRVQSLGWEDPWRREGQPTPVFLPGKSCGQRSLVEYVKSMGSHKVGHNWNVWTHSQKNERKDKNHHLWEEKLGKKEGNAERKNMCESSQCTYVYVQGSCFMFDSMYSIYILHKLFTQE